jgi:uncharacterized membrane protein
MDVIATPAKKPRLFFIDMFRGLAVLVMIEGHVTNSTMMASIQKTEGFHYLDLLNGMPAPSFIFMAGFAFTLGLGRKWDDLMTGGKLLWLQIRRLLFVIAVGYWLHIPIWSFRGMLKMSRESWIYFLRADVLQTIGISLLLALLTAVIVRNKKILMLVLSIFALAVIFVTPFLQDINPLQYSPAPVGAYLNYQNGSLFPMFPWSAYAFLGALFCYWYLAVKGTPREPLFFGLLFASGLILFVLGRVLFHAPWSYHHYLDPAKTSPRFFMFRLGFVFMVLSSLWLYERKRKPERSVLSVTGQESLFIYGFHLLIVYGSVIVPYSIARNVGMNLNYLPSLMLSVLVISLMIVCGLFWHKMKEDRPVLAKRVFYTLCAIYFFRFFFF